jgi:DNA polymerase III gamma/tau subunit
MVIKTSDKAAPGTRFKTLQQTAQQTALYRKYRPHSFADVIGQDHIVRVLAGAVKSGAISHAYLFTGSRGTGKTSVARIFAAEIGCTPNDLYEIDAASNRGIDDVRALRESVGTLPFESRYKVYIVDEVHMLTKEAFNALLKTLEEPPAHAVFILATTEADKLPETVVSRCQVFGFKKPTQAILRELVIDIGHREGFLVESAAAELIALLGDGSFRDTEGILDKVLAGVAGIDVVKVDVAKVGANSDSKNNDIKKITVMQVEGVTGAPRNELINSFVGAFAEEGAAVKALKALREAGAQNVDMKTFLKLALNKLRIVLLLRYAPDMETDICAEVGEDDSVFLKKLANGTAKTTDTIKVVGGPKFGISSKTLVELLIAYDEIGRAAIPSLPIELAVMKLLGQDK